MSMRFLCKNGKQTLAAALVLFALAARLLFPAPAEYVRRRLMGGDALGAAVRAFTSAVSGPGSLGEAISVFCDALYEPE